MTIYRKSLKAYEPEPDGKLGRPVKATVSPKQAAKNQKSRAKYAAKKPK